MYQVSFGKIAMFKMNTTKFGVVHVHMDPMEKVEQIVYK